MSDVLQRLAEVLEQRKQAVHIDAVLVLEINFHADSPDFPALRPVR